MSMRNWNCPDLVVPTMTDLVSVGKGLYHGKTLLQPLTQ